MDEVKVAGLNSNSEFESQKVKEHIKNLAASATVGVFGETDATLVDGTLTIDPNHAVVKVPQISGVVTVKIEDVDLPGGVESANGVQVTLLMEGVDEDAVLSWPVGTITHDESEPGKHVALLMRTKDHWEVFLPPVSSSSVDVNTSTSLFSEEYPALHEKVYDSKLDSMVDGRIIPIQEQISGSVYDLENGKIEYGKITNDRGARTTISDVLGRLWDRVTSQSEKLSRLGKTVTDVEYREYDEEEKFNFPDPLGGYGSIKSTRRPATTVKEIDGTPHLVHWMPKWSENMSKVLSGDMHPGEFSEQSEDHPMPLLPGWSASEEEINAYNQEVKDWVSVWEVNPIAWEAYTVPMTRDETLDVDLTASYEAGGPPVYD